MNEWIDIKIKKPFEMTPVIVVCKGVVQEIICKLYDGDWYANDGDELLNDFYPSHWMPLPEPPK